MLQRQWDSFHLQLYLLCYVMHPAKLLEGLTDRPAAARSLVAYAPDLYERFWGEDANACNRISA